LVVEIGEGDSTGGRRPTLYQLRTGVPAASGIDLTPRITTIAVADLAGNILDKESFSTSPDMAFMSEQIIERTKRLISGQTQNDLEIGMS
ncbi:hypothetical protein OFM36_33435, partial [Escherichia coli]|nr:hypothetical protein [Escherichia coli]